MEFVTTSDDLDISWNYRVGAPSQLVRAMADAR
jgi:hypothetical protein